VFSCPLTRLAQQTRDESGSFRNAYLPQPIARDPPAIHVPLIALAIYLHGRRSAEHCLQRTWAGERNLRD